MPQAIEKGWGELEAGRLEAAEAIFRDYLQTEEHRAEALEGLGYRELMRGNARQAEEYALEALHAEPTPQRRLLLGEALSYRGKRDEAQEILQEASRALPADQQPYARALVGEQLIRRGQWEAGAKELTEALRADAQNPEAKDDAFRELARVLGDLVEARIAGKIAEREAVRFVNQLDYRAPKHDARLESFFSQVRSALSSGQPLRQGDQRGSFTPPPHVRAAATRAPKNAPPQGSPPPKRGDAPERPDGAQAPPAASKPPESDSGDGSIDANKKDLRAVIEHERSQNAGLLADFEEMGPPQWPSKAGYDSLDTVEPISLDRGSVIGGSTNIDTRDFRLTSGDLLTQIFLERCLRNLLATTQRGKSRGVLLRPESIPMLELNCRDGLLEEMRPLSSIYEDRPHYKDYHQLALGTFIGESLAKTHDGTWAYETDPYAVRLRIGAERFEPMNVARAWVEADDRDDIHFEKLIRRAERAGAKSSQMTVTQEYIDPTREMTVDALAATLAELWVEYRVRLEEVSFAQIAASISIVEETSEAIVFWIGAEWVPDFALGVQQSGISRDGTVAMAYLRKSGQFAPLASRKGVVRYLEVSSDKLDREGVRHVVKTLAELHRPRWEFVTDEELAGKLDEATGRDYETPRLDDTSGTSELTVTAHASHGPVVYRVTYSPGELLPWHIEQQ